MLKPIAKKLLNSVGVHDHHVTPVQLSYRLLRAVGFGIERKFEFHGQGLKFRIAAEAWHDFEVFNREAEFRNELEHFIRLSQNRRNLLDIGAFYGIFSLIFASLTHGKACAIEPSPHAYPTLKHHQTLNPGLELETFNIGFGAENEMIGWKFDCLQLVASGKQDKKQFEFPVVRLDDFVRNHAFEPDTIKLDTEGYELSVLRGGSEFLTRCSPILFLEVHVSWMARLGHSPAALISTLRSFGYDHFYHGSESVDPVRKASESDNFRIICSKEKL